MKNLIADQHLDARGLFCPEPVMMLHTKMDELKPGEVLHMMATDPSTIRDVPKFCLFLGHELIASDADETTCYYWVRKGVPL
jgi:tRNA 2-thiouridine synthesizing protein A